MGNNEYDTCEQTLTDILCVLCQYKLLISTSNILFNWVLFPFFRFSVTKKSSHERSYFWIVVDDQRYARFLMYSSDTTPPGSTTINLELNAGQIVMVENDHSTVIFGTEKPSGAILSWFTGHMIYAL